MERGGGEGGCGPARGMRTAWSSDLWPLPLPSDAGYQQGWNGCFVLSMQLGGRQRMGRFLGVKRGEGCELEGIQEPAAEGARKASGEQLHFAGVVGRPERHPQPGSRFKGDGRRSSSTT